MCLSPRPAPRVLFFGEAAKTRVEPVEGVSPREFDFFFDVFW